MLHCSYALWILLHLSQLIIFRLSGQQPELKLLPTSEDALEGVTEVRIEFQNVSDVDATTFELNVLGCIKGRHFHQVRY